MQIVPRATLVLAAVALSALPFFLACKSSATPPAQEVPYVPPPESCDPAPIDSPRAFTACSTGGGIFGAWTLDDLGLPEYDYGLDENADARASYPNTEGIDRRDHHFQFGNSRVTAFFANDGYVELTNEDRGVAYFDKFDDTDQRTNANAWGGGYSFIDDGDATWTTAYKWRPPGSIVTRRFGMGYAETATAYRNVRVSRRIFAPSGDGTALLDEVTLENTSDAPKTITHYEYWDVARRPMEINWIVSGTALTNAPNFARQERDARNGLFNEVISWDASLHALEMRRAYTGSDPLPAKDAASAVDYFPADPFLAIVVGDASAAFTDDAKFFGVGDPSAPDAVVHRAGGESLDAIDTTPRNGLGEPRMFALRSMVTLAPHEKKLLRFAYGYTDMGAPFTIDPAWTDPSRDLRAEAAKVTDAHLMYFASDRNPELHRELAWHSSQMEASVGYRAFWKKHVVPQGSAYLYLHGADGVPRDLMLFALPLIYTDSALAKEQLELTMQLAHGDDYRFSYAFQGHGMLDDALGIHTKPSDIDLFFLWALTEYLGATGDTAFLDESLSYDPPSPANTVTVREHARRAVRHLFDTIGFGDHGLLKLGTGDWSDGISFAAPDRSLAISSGESVPNSQMALYVLPRAAALFADDATLSQEIASRVTGLTAAVSATSNGQFFGRAYFGDGVLYEANTIDLESQVWALVAPSLLNDASRSALISHVELDLDDPSPIGAPLTSGGQVWPAVTDLLTWGYSKSDDELAWAHFARSSLASRARAFPAVWFDVWSGPDGIDSKTGLSWASPVTPMSDFPIANNNTHAMPMLATLKLCGIEATMEGLTIEPHVAGRHFSLATELLDLAQNGGTISGTYRPTGNAPRSIAVRPRAVIQSVTVGGSSVIVPDGATEITFPVPPGASFTVVSS